MHYNYSYQLDLPEPIEAVLLHHVDTRRRLYNHVLERVNDADDIPARYEIRGRPPDLTSWWDTLGDVHSKVLQMAASASTTTSLRSRSKRHEL
jgi:putative transposase